MNRAVERSDWWTAKKYIAEIEALERKIRAEGARSPVRISLRGRRA